MKRRPKVKKRNKIWHKRCRVCRRLLRTKRARRVGMGRSCAKKFIERLYQESLELEGQIAFPFVSPMIPGKKSDHPENNSGQ